MKHTESLTVTMTEKEQRQGFVFLSLNLLLFPALIPFCLRLLLPQGNGAQQNFLYFLLNFLCIGWIFHAFLRKSADALGARTLHLFGTVILGLASYFLLSYQISLWIQRLVPDFFNVNDSSIVALASQNFPLMAASTIFLVPVTEECLYRGLVFGSLFKKSPAMAYVISTILFSAIHVLAYIGSYDHWTLLLCMVQYLPAGICLGWVYQKADSIFAPIIMHAIINAIGIFSVR